MDSEPIRIERDGAIAEIVLSNGNRGNPIDGGFCARWADVRRVPSSKRPNAIQPPSSAGTPSGSRRLVPAGAGADGAPPGRGALPAAPTGPPARQVARLLGWGADPSGLVGQGLPRPRQGDRSAGAPGVVNHVAPTSIRLAASNIGGLARHLNGVAVRAGPCQRPLGAHQGSIARLDHLLRLAAGFDRPGQLQELIQPNGFGFSVAHAGFSINEAASRRRPG